MPIKLASLALLITSAILTGCSSSSDGADNDATTNPVPGSDPIIAPQLSGRYNGNYLRACREDQGVWEQDELSIEGSVAIIRNAEFTDAGCTQLDIEFLTTLSIEFTGGTMNTALGVADFVTSTPETTTFNGESINLGNVPLYDLILLDGNNLHFGLLTVENDGSSPESRPVQIDVDEAAVRL